MRKKVWLINHYANEIDSYQGARQYNFAKYLTQDGYEPLIICSSFVHKGTENFIDGNRVICEKEIDGLRYCFVRTSPYRGNGLARYKNMLEFAFRLIRNQKKIVEAFGKPDVIIGSSPQPFTCVASIRIAKKLGCRVISDIKDLWPETLVELGMLKRNSILTNILYLGERWIYRKSDYIIFTMPGGKQYLIDKGWDKKIDLSKVSIISNGVDLQRFDEEKERTVDEPLLTSPTFKIIFTGKITKPYGLNKVILALEKLYPEHGDKISFFIYGRGEEREELEEYCTKHNLHNIHFMGSVGKKMIPSVLCASDLLLLSLSDIYADCKTGLTKYGISPTKLGEYMAAGKPILLTQPTAYNILEEEKCGITFRGAITIDELAMAIKDSYNLSVEEYTQMSLASRALASQYDYKNLTKKLIVCIES